MRELLLIPSYTTSFFYALAFSNFSKSDEELCNCNFIADKTRQTVVLSLKSHQGQSAYPDFVPEQVIIKKKSTICGLLPDALLY